MFTIIIVSASNIYIQLFPVITTMYLEYMVNYVFVLNGVFKMGKNTCKITFHNIGVFEIL